MREGFSIDHVNLSFAGFEVLRDINITVPRGQFTCLLGASGSGKTTLLSILAGLQRPDTGNVLWDGVPIDGPSPSRAVVFQEYTLFPWMTLCSNVALAVRKTHAGIKRKEAKQVAMEYLEMVGLAHAAEKYPFELSGGMRQRGAIARALSTGAEVLLMDEPFGALDPVNRLKLQELLLGVCKNGRKVTVLFVTHDIGEALYLGDRVIVLGSNPGRIIADRPVHFGTSRGDRAKWFKDAEVVKLTVELEGIFQQDVLDRMDLGNALKGGSGI